MTAQVDLSPRGLALEYANLIRAVTNEARHRVPWWFEVDELEGIAGLGLMSAANEWGPYCERRSFDPARVEYFKAYAWRRMHGAILDQLRRNDHVSRRVRTNVKQVAAVEAGATHASVAKATGLSVAAVREARREAQRPLSLDLTLPDRAAGLDVTDPTSTEGVARAHQLMSVAVDAIKTLSRPEQIVLALVYFAGMGLREAAQTMEITEHVAGRLHTSAVLAVHTALVAAEDTQLVG